MGDPDALVVIFGAPLASIIAPAPGDIWTPVRPSARTFALTFLLATQVRLVVLGATVSMLTVSLAAPHELATELRPVQ